MRRRAHDGHAPLGLGGVAEARHRGRMATPAERRERGQFAAASRAGSEAKPPAVGAAVAGVESQPGERPDVGAGRVAGIGDAAQPVEDVVVGVEPAGDALHARGADLALEAEEIGAEAAEEALVEGGCAERRVAAALQVEAAVQDAGRSISPSPRPGRDPSLGTEPRERGGGREQLHVRGQRARALRRPRADGLAAAPRRPRTAHSLPPPPRDQAACISLAELPRAGAPRPPGSQREARTEQQESTVASGAVGPRLPISWDNPCLWAKLWTSTSRPQTGPRPQTPIEDRARARRRRIHRRRLRDRRPARARSARGQQHGQRLRRLRRHQRRLLRRRRCSPTASPPTK